MASIFAQRLVLGASLGLGALDVAWLNLVLAPRVLARAPAEVAAAPSASDEVDTAAVLAEPAPRRVARTADGARGGGDEVIAVGEAASAPAPAGTGAARTTAGVSAEVAEAVPDAAARREIDTHETSAGSVVERVYFATMQWGVAATARQRVRELVASAPADAVFVLAGFADHRGEEAYNRGLARRRATAVARLLGELGVDAARVRIGQVGELPRSGGALWRDRRVDIHIEGEAR